MLASIKNRLEKFIARCVANGIVNVMRNMRQLDIEMVSYILASVESARYFQDHMSMAPNLRFRTSLLDFALRKVTLDEGLWLEFGVFQGSSIARIAIQADSTVYGFDSFEGLPEDWTHFQKKGRFSLDGQVPKGLPDNVVLVKGWFEDTLPDFLVSHSESVAFLHVDCDIYSSTKFVLDELKNRIVPGSVILFDEFFNYPGWQIHEARAFSEFMVETGFAFEYLGFASADHSIAIKIVAKK